jgi:hypothetical protein
MAFAKADEYRLQAEKCLDQVEIAPSIGMKQRMRWLADEWLKMAIQATLEEENVGVVRKANR